MRRLLAEIAGPLAWFAPIAGLLVAFALLPHDAPRPTPSDPEPAPGGLASPASDEGRRYEMERAIIDLRARVEALEEGR